MRSEGYGSCLCLSVYPSLVPRPLPFYEFDAGERVWPIDQVYGGPLEFVWRLENYWAWLKWRSTARLAKMSLELQAHYTATRFVNAAGQD